MRRCKAKECRKELQPASKCTEFIEKKGFCSYECLLAFGYTKRLDSERKKARQAKQGLKTRGDLTREAQAAFNKYIRIRDAKEPCISCQGYPNHGSSGGSWDCGHYRSVGANPELRFNVFNAHKQCKRCNNQLSGNIVNYRINLIKKIGDAKLAEIEGPHEAKHYSQDDLKRIKRIFNKKAKLYEQRFRK